MARASVTSAPASPPALGRQIREEGRPPLGPRTKVSQAQKRSIRLPPRCARVERERERPLGGRGDVAFPVPDFVVGEAGHLPKNGVCRP